MTAKLLIALVWLYRLTLAPFLGGSCRFAPTCSAYAIEALRTHGARRGVLLTVRRLAACHPFGRSGYDPVPTSALRATVGKPAPAHSPTGAASRN